MAARRTASVRVRRDSREFTTVLASAVLEWLLIFLLFVDSLFSYLLTRYARFFKLQTPCLLCSRLDHVVGNEKPGFYMDLICGTHKLEMSSLVFCHVHDKFADVHGMCEGCLLSFATNKKSNSKTYRLLVGKMGSDLECSVDHDPLLKDNINSSSKRQCSCCNESWISRMTTHTLLQAKSIGPEVSELDIPLPDSEETSRSNLYDDLKKSVERKSMVVSSSKVQDHSSDPLSHIGYTELKITSDSESEVHFSDDDDSNSKVHAGHGPNEEVAAQCASLNSHATRPEILLQTLSDDFGSVNMIRKTSVDQSSVFVPELQRDAEKLHEFIPSPSAASVVEKTLSDDLASVCLIHQTPIDKPSVLVPELQHDVEKSNGLIPSASEVTVAEKTLSDDLASLNTIHLTSMGQPFLSVPESQHEVGKSHDLVCSASAAAVVEKTLSNGLASVNFVHQTSMDEPSLLGPELQHDVEKSHDLISSASAAAAGHGLEDVNWHHVEKKANPSTLPELVIIHDVSASSSVKDALVNTSEETLDVRGSGENGVASNITRSEISQSESGSNTASGSEKTDQALNGAAPAVTNLMDLSDVYKLVSGNKGSHVSNMLAERLSPKDSAKITEDLKLLLSQISAARGLDSSMNEMSPRVHRYGEDLNGLQILQKRISIERNESGIESFEGSIVSEIEGEGMVERLRRQVEYDRKSMSALYKELEEERNASSIAANQAMAMITRLQEEKATLQMEALQYLRMMEEQAEYDGDALQKANDLLAEKDKELLDLEAELEFYRKRSSCKSIFERTEELVSDAEGRDMRMERSDVICIGDNVIAQCESASCENPGSSIEPEKTNMVNGNRSTRNGNDSLEDFEGERLYISQCLKKLEKKLSLFSNNGVYMPNGGYSEKESNGVNHPDQLHWEVPQGSSKMEDDAFSAQKDSCLSHGSPHAQERHTSSFVGPQFVDEEDYYLDRHRGGSVIIQESELNSFENEVSALNERLKALEADRNFLEHTINSLRAGDEGVQFIQEIAHHLRALHRIVIRRDQTSF